MASMDTHKQKGGDIKKEFEKGVKEIQEKGKEYQGVVNELNDMPDGLDSDLQAGIQDIKSGARGDVTDDIESTEKAIIDAAKAEADTLKTDVNAKIGDNTKAKSKLQGITSDYGKDAKSKAITSIDANTKIGVDLIAELDATIENSADDIQTVKNNIQS